MKMIMNRAIKSEGEYQAALARYEVIKHSKLATNPDEYREKIRLINLIVNYEDKTSELPEVSEQEMKEIRFKEFGYKK